VRCSTLSTDFAEPGMPRTRQEEFGDVAELVREWRSRENLSLERAAAQLGVAHTTVRDWERGRRPRDTSHAAIMRVLAIPPRQQDTSWLRERRHALGLSIKQVAKATSVSASSVVKWERQQRRPLPVCVPLLAGVLCVSETEVEHRLGVT
jgi:transcriptional regulator with XRE-family HTH domain